MRAAQNKHTAAAHRQLSEPWDDVFVHHWNAVAAKAEGRFGDACDEQMLAVKALLLVLETSSDWLLPALQQMNADMRRLATQADAELQVRNEKPVKLEAVAQVLQSCFRITIGDRAKTNSRKWGTLHTINLMLRLYFQVNNLKLCKNLVRAVDSPAFPPFDQFPLSQRVTYKFYVGRLGLLNADFAAAENDLAFAFLHCPRSKPANRRSILTFLVPVRLHMGKLPTEALLQKHGLPEFLGIVRKVATLKRGNSDETSDHRGHRISGQACRAGGAERRA